MPVTTPETGPSHLPPGSERMTLGLAFIGTGAALSSWFDAFRALGALLILIGLGILISAVWPPLRSTLVHASASPSPRKYWILAGWGLATALSAGVWWWIDDSSANPTPAAGPPADSADSCSLATAQCLFTVAERNPGDPLIWVIPREATGESSDGVLEADARLDGDVAGRYVALACRVDDAGGEYVFAIRPENQSFRLLRWDQDVSTQVAGERLPALIRPANQVNELRLDCHDSTITGYVNGRRVAMTAAASGTQGKWYLAAGIFAENTQPASIAATFDHIAMRRATPVP